MTDTITISTEDAPSDIGVLVYLDPSTLLVDRNVREVKLDKAFLASIKKRGVQEPIRAVQTDAGVRVRTGNRRTLAAVQAGRRLVPVWLKGTESEDTAERIIDQIVENEHRTDMTNSGVSIIRHDSLRVRVNGYL